MSSKLIQVNTKAAVPAGNVKLTPAMFGVWTGSGRMVGKFGSNPDRIWVTSG
jgi:hypothetical protein